MPDDAAVAFLATILGSRGQQCIERTRRRTYVAVIGVDKGRISRLRQMVRSLREAHPLAGRLPEMCRATAREQLTEGLRGPREVDQIDGKQVRENLHASQQGREESRQHVRRQRDGACRRGRNCWGYRRTSSMMSSGILSSISRLLPLPRRGFMVIRVPAGSKISLSSCVDRVLACFVTRALLTDVIFGAQ